MLDQIADRVYVNTVTGCWEWLLCRNKWGYARWFYKRKARLAHRVAFELLKGWLPEGPLDHLCKVRHCVNPDHLEPVTPAVNTQRSSKAKLTRRLVEDIRKRYAGRYGQRVSLMREFGISSTQFRRIIMQEQWV